MKILAIETSCDDTGIAILEVKNSKFNILANIVSSQTIHANYGGVFPIMAKREHQNNLIPVLISALTKAKLLKNKSIVKLTAVKITVLFEILEKESYLFEFVKEFLETYQKPDINFIAVTNGPGLEPCLWVGVNFAKALSYFWDIPVIAVNHIEAHILINFLPKANESTKSQIPNPKQIQNYNALNSKTSFPAVALIVSGGHTQLILVKGIGKYKIIGETLDDAAGECFDKASRILGLGYPGGPIISKIAEKWDGRRASILLPRPMMYTKDYNFSFSGLKTAVLYKVRDTDPKIVKSQEFIEEMCFAVQDAICDVLIKKTLSAVKDYKVKTIILGGGVSANEELRKRFYSLFTTNYKLNLLIPPANLSTDNGLMIAIAGYFNKNKKTSWKNLKVNANLRV